MLSARNCRLVCTLASATFLSLMIVPPASAQCDYNPIGFQGAAVQPNNPLQADYSTTGLLHNFTGITAGMRPGGGPRFAGPRSHRQFCWDVQGQVS